MKRAGQNENFFEDSMGNVNSLYRWVLWPVNQEARTLNVAGGHDPYLDHCLSPTMHAEEKNLVIREKTCQNMTQTFGHSFKKEMIGHLPKKA